MHPPKVTKPIIKVLLSESDVFSHNMTLLTLITNLKFKLNSTRMHACIRCTCVQKLNTVCHLFRQKPVSNMRVLYTKTQIKVFSQQNIDECTIYIHSNKM